MPRSGADDRARDADRGADHRGDVHPRHERGARLQHAGTGGPHRPHPADDHPRARLVTRGAVGGPIVILMLTSRLVANSSIVFTGNTRMPMVAGWDQLLPAWFTRLHPRYRTPVNSILFVGAVSLAFGLAGIAGVGEQEAFQLLDNAAGILYGLTYLVLFALPFVAVGRGVSGWPRASRPLRIAAMAGLATTILYVILSIFPIIDVPSWRMFAVKISSVVIGLNLVGLLVYALGGRRRERAQKRDRNRR